jgi:hypothetical protein
MQRKQSIQRGRGQERIERKQCGHRFRMTLTNRISQNQENKMAVDHLPR